MSNSRKVLRDQSVITMPRASYRSCRARHCHGGRKRWLPEAPVDGRKTWMRAFTHAMCSAGRIIAMFLLRNSAAASDCRMQSIKANPEEKHNCELIYLIIYLILYFDG